MFQWIVFQSIWKWPWHHKERKRNSEQRKSIFIVARIRHWVGSNTVQRIFLSTKRRESLVFGTMTELVAQKDVNIFTKHVLMKINNKSFSVQRLCCVECLHTAQSKIFYGFSHTPRMSMSWITKELFLPVWVNHFIKPLKMKSTECMCFVHEE